MSNDLQGEDWRNDRAGKITASRFQDACSFRKDGKPSSERMKYMRQLAFERLSGSPIHEIGGKALSYGKDAERAAKDMYQLKTGYFLDDSGLILHQDYDFIGCSPDGLVDNDGGAEFKCPHDEAVHIQTWLDGMPEDHTYQVQGCMFVTGRQWWDFNSFDFRQAPALQLYTQRIHRDDAFIETMKSQLLQFEKELQEMIGKITARMA